MNARKLNLAILISGRGSNMQTIIEACRDPDFPALVRVVISNNPDAGGLNFAKAENIPCEVINHRNYTGKETFEKALNETLDRYPVDLICLAGFMRLLSACFIESRKGRIVNVHPSLLPLYKGLYPHERVLNDGGTETGCTIHYVTEDMDAGPIILQRRIAIQPDETPESLARRVLDQEHIAYPEAIRIIAQNTG